jgi:hypothetical protein
MSKPTDPTDSPAPAAPSDGVPDVDAPATPSERVHARTFGELVDRALTDTLPPAMAADDRELLDVAALIRAGAPTSAPGCRRPGSARWSTARCSARSVARAQPPPIRPRPAPAWWSRWRRADRPGRPRPRPQRLPWIVAGVATVVAAAAVLALLLRPAPRGPGPASLAETAPVVEVPEHWRSRPADPLIGAIDPARSGDALARIDTIYADRLGGYRERTLSPRRTGVDHAGGLAGDRGGAP